MSNMKIKGNSWVGRIHKIFCEIQDAHAHQVGGANGDTPQQPCDVLK